MLGSTIATLSAWSSSERSRERVTSSVLEPPQYLSDASAGFLTERELQRCVVRCVTLAAALEHALRELMVAGVPEGEESCSLACLESVGSRGVGVFAGALCGV